MDPHRALEPSSPTFCPRCRKAGAEGGSLCAECGEGLADQGFCGVCDRFWNLPVGDPCPKHDLALEGAPPPRDLGRAEGAFVDWTSVAAYPHTMAAEAPRIRLEAEGIPTFLEGSRMSEHGLYHLATGGVRLQVPRDLAHEARIVLSQTWAAPTEPDDDLEDAWDDLAPAPHARRKAIMKAAIVLVLALPVLRLILGLIGGR